VASWAQVWRATLYFHHPNSEEIVRVTWTLVGAALLAACATDTKDGDETAADTAAPAATAAAASDDPDNQTGGSGVPAGYVGQVDPPRGSRPAANIADAKYVANGNRWEITTGPAHIVYAAKDSASGTYTATASFEQLEAPQHPEAFGLFIGGQNLDQPSQRYTYFIVRGTGEYLVRVRDGAETRDVLDWRAAPSVPKADGSGKASYKLTAQVGADSVRFLVNDTAVASVAKSAVPTDGVVGLRVNHNLHVMAEPVVVTR
jgi:hypothetical protein